MGTCAQTIPHLGFEPSSLWNLQPRDELWPEPPELRLSKCAGLGRKLQVEDQSSFTQYVHTKAPGVLQLCDLAIDAQASNLNSQNA